MDCPKCESPLLAARVREVEVDQCKSCGGVWLDHRELATLLSLKGDATLRKVASSKAEEALNLKRATCPRDASPLMRVYSVDVPTVVVDNCPTCQGIWLDGGELKKLLRA